MIIDELLENNNLDKITFYQFGNYFKENFVFLNEEVKVTNKIYNDNNELNKHIKIAKDAGFDIEKFEKDLLINIEKERDSFGNISFNDKNLKNKIDTYKNKLIKICEDHINNIKEYFKDKEKLKKLTKDVAFSIILFLAVGQVNAILSEILNIAVPGLGKCLINAIRAALVEELAKRLADKFNFGDTYNMIFNIGEFSLYTKSLLKKGVTLPKAILARIPAVIMHTVNTYLIKNAGKNDDDPKVKNKKKNLMTIITFIIHTAFNTYFSYGANTFKKWLLK